MIYVLYEDDGPGGPCGQDYDTTSNWSRLYVFRDDQIEEARKFIDNVTTKRGRRRARIAGHWSDNPLAGMQLVINHQNT